MTIVYFNRNVGELWNYGIIYIEAYLYISKSKSKHKYIYIYLFEIKSIDNVMYYTYMYNTQQFNFPY